MLKMVVCKVFVLMVCIEVVCCKLPSEQVSAITSVFDIIQNDTARSLMWTKNSNPCLWEGVGCSPHHSSIITISFYYFGISTSDFLPFLCNITTLESVDVSWNQLSSKGLAFLHECTSGPIILLHLCSKSILLKSMDVPQISDIELCSLVHPSKTRESMAALDASVGYVPPEYGSTKRVTAAGNVYSFGVVLLELVTGKPEMSEGSELAKWVLSISEQRNRWDEILDSSVSETSVVVKNQMVAVLEVAFCISPETRPNSATVLEMLQSRRSNNQGR